jgi:hypothetical protein
LPQRRFPSHSTETHREALDKTKPTVATQLKKCHKNRAHPALLSLLHRECTVFSIVTRGFSENGSCRTDQLFSFYTCNVQIGTHAVPPSHRALSPCRSPICGYHWGAVTDPTTPLRRLTRAYNVRAAAVSFLETVRQDSVRYDSGEYV